MDNQYVRQLINQCVIDVTAVSDVSKVVDRYYTILDSVQPATMEEKMNISTQMEYAENQQVTTIKINALDIAAVQLTEEEQVRKAQLEASSSIADHVLALEILVRAIETSQISSGNGQR